MWKQSWTCGLFCYLPGTLFARHTHGPRMWTILTGNNVNKEKVCIGKSALLSNKNEVRVTMETCLMLSHTHTHTDTHTNARKHARAHTHTCRYNQVYMDWKEQACPSFSRWKLRLKKSILDQNKWFATVEMNEQGFFLFLDKSPVSG